MAEPTTVHPLKELLTKDPQLWFMGIMIITGGAMMSKNDPGPTWYVGLSLIGIAIVAFIVKLVATFFDESHQRNFVDLITHQKSTIKSQTAVIREFSKNTIAAHQSVTSQSQPLPGGYARPGGNVTLSTPPSQTSISEE